MFKEVKPYTCNEKFSANKIDSVKIDVFFNTGGKKS